MESSSQAQIHPQSQADNASRSTTAIPDLVIETLGRGVKELVQAINKIEQLGITKVAGDTPKIVVIGDQSTGKSSVINAISGIQVPRSSGTCTRCPMQITLTENKEPNARWRCEVSLRQEFWYDGNRASYPAGQKPPHFYPWDENETPETTHFKTVYNKRELQHVIYQAQLATLNPGSDPMTFVPMQAAAGIGGGHYEVEFSPNLVCLDISAPNLPNLSFYDLPGVIAQLEHGQDLSLIKLVKQLVKRYISKDNALVLLACSMENDIHNSSSAGLLRKERVQEQLSKIDAELLHLPEPPTTDALRIVLDAINNFTAKVSKQMEGEHPENQFRLVWKGLRAQFREGITAQRPTMLVRTAGDVKDARERRATSAMPQSQNSSFIKQKDVISIDDSDNERAASVQQTPTKKRKLASDTPSSRRGQLGDEYTMSTLNQALDDTLRAWKTTELSRETAHLTESFFNMAFTEQRDMAVPRALRLERHKPMTENRVALESNEKKELEIFQNARILARTTAYFDELDATTQKQTSRVERQRKANDVSFRSQLGPDPFAREVEAMSKIRGYYNLASMRYVDAVVMGIQVELFEKLKEGLRNELTTVLGIAGENVQDTCARLLAEDPARELRRRALKADKEKLVAALNCLQELDQKYQQGMPATHPTSNGLNGSGPVQAGPSRQAPLEDDMEMNEA
ncbi:putative dynamin family protein [Neofusicoccum parvum UCRNP2]|uniref:Putative dynamin family protein n=1 Tax=Botryosphaeria parva (strain UCR-NP2) TaxID=1287680 RepID=R1G8Q2_BOTPV|nr:putative dynamin family protein [Neofusicoccum parvum UCRNP2]